MNTRRYPRTLNEAFGPYTSSHIEEKPTGYSLAWWLAVCACAVACAVVIGVTA